MSKKQEIVCLECNSKDVIKKGERKLRSGKVQRFQCSNCGNNFSDRKIANSSYSAKIILEAINNYNRGLNLKESSKKINSKFHVKTYPMLISSWLKRYKKIVPYLRFRKKEEEQQEIVECLFEHQQPYLYCFHKNKVERFLNNYFSGLREHLEDVKEGCPDEIFGDEENRASQKRVGIDFSKVKIIEKKNFACEVVEFALKSVKNNHERHDLVERFLLTNDTATLAIEVPVWLKEEEIPSELREIFGKDFSFLTGHIDIVQARFGLIYILDYKPNASKENNGKVISQLLCYAVAISVRTGIWLRNFKCGWFDEKNYYEFSCSEVVGDYLEMNGVDDERILRKYVLDEKARKYFTGEKFHSLKNGKSGSEESKSEESKSEECSNFHAKKEGIV